MLNTLHHFKMDTQVDSVCNPTFLPRLSGLPIIYTYAFMHMLLLTIKSRYATSR